MRILQVITSLTHGGAEHLLVNAMNRLTHRHEITVAYLKGEPYLAPRLSDRVRIVRAGLNAGTLGRLRALAREVQAEVVHTHLPHADFLGLPAVTGLPGRRFSTLHNIWYKWDWRDHGMFRAYRALYNVLAPRTQVLAISQCVAQHARDRLGVPPRRVTVLRNAIPVTIPTPTRAEARRELGVAPGQFCVLFVGRLTMQKSVDTLIQAAGRLRSALPELTVLLVGEGRGYREEELRALTTQLGLDETVRFCGRAERPEVHFAAADAFVLPSVFEGLGLVILEAFRAAVPVIATSVEGPAELIRDGENGLLFAPRDVDGLAAQIVRLYRDRGLGQRLGEAGRTSLLAGHDIDAYAAQLEALYDGRVVSTPEQDSSHVA